MKEEKPHNKAVIQTACVEWYWQQKYKLMVCQQLEKEIYIYTIMYIVPDGIIVMKIHILKPEKGNSVFFVGFCCIFGLLPKMNISYFF